MMIIHSFCKNPNCSKESFAIHMYYFALSCVYAKKTGFNIRLHCDKETAEVLKFCPYDEIVIDLDSSECPHPLSYAWPKFKAMKDEDLGNIHIDGDVFLKKPILKDILNFKNYDCIVQGIEIYSQNFSCWNDTKSFCNKLINPKFLKPKLLEMYNCGTVGINNKTLKDEYFKVYNDCINFLSNHIDKNINADVFNMHVIPDIIYEQQVLQDLCEYKNYTTKIIIPGNTDDDLVTYANKIGYQHVIGGTFKKLNLHLCKKVLEMINPKVFKLVDNYLTEYIISK